MGTLNYLGLDLGKECGYCFGTKKGEYGIWNLAKYGTSPGMATLELGANLKPLIEKHNIKVICYEHAFIRFASAAKSFAKFVGKTEEICCVNGIENTHVAPTTLKKFATGSGRASKDEMIATLKEKHKISVSNHNICDAIWLYLWVTDKYEI